MAKVVGIIEFSWGGGIAAGPLIAEVLYNIGGFPLPLYVFSGVTVILALMTFLFMDKKVEGGEDKVTPQEASVVITVDSTQGNQVVSTGGAQKKISMFKLFGYKLFVFAILGAFFNLILYVLLEPILSDRLTELGVEEKNLGQYF